MTLNRGYTRAVAETGVGEGSDCLSLIVLNVIEFNKYVALNNGKKKNEREREGGREGQKLRVCDAADVTAKIADPGAGLSAQHGPAV